MNDLNKVDRVIRKYMKYHLGLKPRALYITKDMYNNIGSEFLSMSHKNIIINTLPEPLGLPVFAKLSYMGVELIPFDEKEKNIYIEGYSLIDRIKLLISKLKKQSK